MRYRPTALVALVFAGVVLTTAIPVIAEEVTFRMTGIVTSPVPGLPGKAVKACNLAPGTFVVNSQPAFEIGQPVAFTYTFDSGWSNQGGWFQGSTPATFEAGAGYVIDSNTMVGILVDNFTTQKLPTTTFGNYGAEMWSDSPATLSAPTLTVDGLDVVPFDVWFEIYTDPFSDLSLPITPPQTAIQHSYWSIAFRRSDGEFDCVGGAVTTIELVVGNSAATPTGSNVTVSPVATLPNGSTATVTVAFDQVALSGATTVTTSSAGAPPSLPV
jgi:hypothetical protein